MLSWIEEFRKRGFDFIPKPLSVTALLIKVREVLDEGLVV